MTGFNTENSYIMRRIALLMLAVILQPTKNRKNLFCKRFVLNDVTSVVVGSIHEHTKSFIKKNFY